MPMAMSSQYEGRYQDLEIRFETLEESSLHSAVPQGLLLTCLVGDGQALPYRVAFDLHADRIPWSIQHMLPDNQNIFMRSPVG